jgi:hypothetical protein
MTERSFARVKQQQNPKPDLGYDGGKQQHQTRTFSKEFAFTINYGKEFNSMEVSKRVKYMRVEEAKVVV